jgi:hypothetical protein
MRSGCPDQQSFVPCSMIQDCSGRLTLLSLIFPAVHCLRLKLIRLMNGHGRCGRMITACPDCPGAGGVRMTVYSRGSLIAVGRLSPTAEGDLQSNQKGC